MSLGFHSHDTKQKKYFIALQLEAGRSLQRQQLDQRPDTCHLCWYASTSGYGRGLDRLIVAQLSLPVLAVKAYEMHTHLLSSYSQSLHLLYYQQISRTTFFLPSFWVSANQALLGETAEDWTRNNQMAGHAFPARRCASPVPTDPLQQTSKTMHQHFKTPTNLLAHPVQRPKPTWQLPPNHEMRLKIYKMY